VTLVLYVAVERWVAPHLQGTIERLREFYFVRNVDHRMRPNDPDVPTNEDGIRSSRPASAFAAPGRNVVILGDSFLYGYKLAFEQSVPLLVERQLQEQFPGTPVRVANFAWTSSSPLLAYRLLRDIGAKYRPELVVQCIDMTDFHDDLKYAALLARDGIYRYYDRFPLALTALKTISPGAFRRLVSWSLSGAVPPQVFFASRAPLEETRPKLSALVENLRRIDGWAREHGARFAVVVVPRNYQYSKRESPRSWERNAYEPLGPYALEPFRFFSELDGKLGFPVYSLLPAFQRTQVFPTCFVDDPHWNEDGARVAAEALAPLVASLMLTRPS
jgi:lysophospholipase L1-like esterase